MGELLWADGGTAFGRLGNCFGPMGELLLANGELLLANGGTAFGQWGNRIQSLCYNSIKNHYIILDFKLLAT